MSVLFPRIQEFSPLFRLADQIEQGARQATQHSRSFAPRFDINETPEHYELHGDFPGINQSDINVEWTDVDTLTISGHTERKHQTSSNGNGYHQPTVEEADDTEAKKDNQTAVAKKSDETAVAQQDPNRPRYLISERFSGSFHRSFQFPSRIDQDAVKASMKNGVLTIVVPKVTRSKESRKITIE